MRTRPPNGVVPLSLFVGAVLWTAGGEKAPSPLEPALALPPSFALGGGRGAPFTMFNANVDGSGQDVCESAEIGCNIYGAKEYVWLNGGPAVNGLAPDGEYFFVVLEPGGQRDPNDGGAENLSDDYDSYSNRTFIVSGGKVGGYEGDHWFDSGKHGGARPDRRQPMIRLFPYADTGDPDGVYTVAICPLRDGYPVESRHCEYDAFKVDEGEMDYSLSLSGKAVRDLDFDGYDADDPGLPSRTIVVTGTGPDGSRIDVRIMTDANGHWEWYSPIYDFRGNAEPQEVGLTVCEALRAGWHQTDPGGDGCRTLDFAPSGFDAFMDLNFANAIFEGCSPDFWRGGGDGPNAKVGGALLWDGIDEVAPRESVTDPPPHVDRQWFDGGGDVPPGNPYIHGTEFNTFFGAGAPRGVTMLDLIDTGGGSEAWRKAARSLVAGYLNASWGMSYAYAKSELEDMWETAVGDDDALHELHTLLDAANHGYGRDFGGPRCPISTGGF